MFKEDKKSVSLCKKEGSQNLIKKVKKRKSNEENEWKNQKKERE